MSPRLVSKVRTRWPLAGTVVGGRPTLTVVGSSGLGSDAQAQVAVSPAWLGVAGEGGTGLGWVAPGPGLLGCVSLGWPADADTGWSRPANHTEPPMTSSTITAALTAPSRA